MKLHISETGDVETVETVSGDPIFQPAAIEALKKWKFQPYIHNGKPAKVISEVPMSFFDPSRVKTFSDHDPSPHLKSPSPYGPALILPERIPVGDEISEGVLLRRAMPIYPAKAKLTGIQGTVLLLAVIRRDGLIGEMKVISGPKELVQSATDAVSLWHYRPYMRDGKPVEVETTIQVNYTLSH